MKSLFIFSIFLLFFSCGQKKENKDPEDEQDSGSFSSKTLNNQLIEEKNEITYFRLIIDSIEPAKIELVPNLFHEGKTDTVKTITWKKSTIQFLAAPNDQEKLLFVSIKDSCIILKNGCKVGDPYEQTLSAFDISPDTRYYKNVFLKNTDFMTGRATTVHLNFTNGVLSEILYWPDLNSWGN